jgi:hypothetical protein
MKLKKSETPRGKLREVSNFLINNQEVNQFLLSLRFVEYPTNFYYTPDRDHSRSK